MRLSMDIRRLRPQNAMRKLPFPAASHLRVAQVAGTPFFSEVETFWPQRWDELESFRPQILAGPATDLQRLAERVQLHTIDLTDVDHAIFVLTECGDKPLTDVLRVVLWQTFGVPVYELFVGEGQLLASECEVHEGWHVEAPAAFSVIGNELVIDTPGRHRLRSGLIGYFEDELCPCGRPGIRVMNLRSSSSPNSRRELAAIA